MTEDTALLDRGPSADAGTDPVLQVEDLRTYFDTRDGVVKAVDGLSFSVRPGEILSVVGESGCGKSITSLSVMQLLPRPPARFASTCGGQVSLTVTSTPALIMSALWEAPTAPAPQKATLIGLFLALHLTQGHFSQGRPVLVRNLGVGES